MSNQVNLDFDKMGGLLPAIVQDAATGEVLMLAFMNQEAWERTLATGEAHYYSRTRQTDLAQGRHFRPRAAGQRDFSGLRPGHGAPEGGAGGRGRLPYRSPELLLSPAAGGRLAGGGLPNL